MKEDITSYLLSRGYKLIKRKRFSLLFCKDNIELSINIRTLNKDINRNLYKL